MSTPVPTSPTSQWSDPPIITVAPNGAYKQPADHRALPVTPQALAARWA
ncbi:3-keto-5-aminohexanoate cleavage enzyme [Delftia lacustris]|uniref:3-keto-5-aminohexanoate cleavage enzyme n=1 Tax=Delftia lacustris TaxID=558537 RepID=A0A1H3PIR3_9BURK|nr:3-keto-5-aminohexanoate cleavage enzyme [Delftia lacustris]